MSKLVLPEAQLLCKYFTIQKRLGQLAEGKQGWMNCVRKGRIHSTYITNGTVTGRATHRHPNIAQVPAVGAMWGKECRSLFRASPGSRLIGADLSGLELRCLAHYMARFDNVDYGAELLKGDIHTSNQQAAGLENRDQAKTFIYAFLYGAGAAKIGSIVGKGPKQGQQLKKRFLAKTPALAKLLQSVDKIAATGALTGLDGRKLQVRLVHAALNTLLQSAGALLAKQWLVEIKRGLEAAGLDHMVNIVAWVHDEVQIEVNLTDISADKHDERCEQVAQIACDAAKAAGEYFDFRIPIEAQAKQGANWAETH